MTTRYVSTLFGTTNGEETRSGLRAIFGFFRLYLDSVAEAYRAWQDFERLNAMSDAELAELGQTRDGILQRVLDDYDPPTP